MLHPALALRVLVEKLVRRCGFRISGSGFRVEGKLVSRLRVNGLRLVCLRVRGFKEAALCFVLWSLEFRVEDLGLMEACLEVWG